MRPAKILASCLVALSVIAGLRVLTAPEATDPHLASAQSTIDALRLETRELRELVERRPTQVQALRQTEVVVKLAQAAERQVAAAERGRRVAHAMRVRLLQSVNVAHGELAEADEEVVGAAAGGLERQIDMLADISRRQEAVVGPQLAR